MGTLKQFGFVILWIQLMCSVPYSNGQDYCSPYNDDQNGYAVRDCGYVCQGQYYPCCDRRVPVSSSDYDTKYYCWCCQTTCEDPNAICRNGSLYGPVSKNSTVTGAEKAHIYQRNAQRKKTVN